MLSECMVMHFSRMENVLECRIHWKGSTQMLQAGVFIMGVSYRECVRKLLHFQSIIFINFLLDSY